jgi:hypothetical protein
MSYNDLLKEDRKHIEELRRQFWLQVAESLAFDFEYDLDIINPAQFRLSKDNKAVDLFPIGMKWHKIHNGKRGNTTTIEKFITDNFGANAAPYKPEIAKWHKSTKKRKSNKKRRKALTMDSLMPIGKHKGTCMRDVPRAFLKYVYENEYTSEAVMQFVKAHYTDLFQ